MKTTRDLDEAMGAIERRIKKLRQQLRKLKARHAAALDP